MYSMIISSLSKFRLALSISGALFAISLFLVSCDSDSDNNEAAMATLLATQTTTEESCDIDLESYSVGGSGSVDCTSGAEATGEVYLSRTNDAHPLLSLEVTYQLESGGSLQILGGVKTVGDDGSFDYGHGIKINNDDAFFMGLNGSGEVQELEVHSETVGEFTSGTDEQTICFEIHMGTSHNEPHILINWTNNSCDTLSSDEDADADSEGEDHDHEESSVVHSLKIPVKTTRELGNDESTESLQNYTTYGLILNNAVVQSITRFTSPHFPHG